MVNGFIEMKLFEKNSIAKVTRNKFQKLELLPKGTNASVIINIWIYLTERIWRGLWCECNARENVAVVIVG